MVVKCLRSCRPPVEGAARAEVSAPGDGSSRAVRSPRLPGPVPGISTPLSLLGALPRGEGSLLQDDWAPGLDWHSCRDKVEDTGSEGVRSRLVPHPHHALHAWAGT